MQNDTRCSDEQIAMWIQIYVDSGIPNIKEAIAARAKAFNEIYQCYRTKLYTYLRFMGCEEALANQIFENIWERIINTKSEIAKQAKNETLNFGVHIFTIARTQLLEHSKELNKFGSIVKRDTLSENAVSFASRIVKIPLRERDTFLLRRMGLSLQQIAQVQRSSGEVSVSDVQSVLESIMRDYSK